MPGFRYLDNSTLVYSSLALALCAGRVYVFVTSAPGAYTLLGATVGQPLSVVKRLYPQLRCGMSTGDSTDPPVPLFPYCTGKLGPGLYLYFGQDPIASIAMATVPLH